MHRILKADGTWMIVEPIAGDRPEDNIIPSGGFTTVLQR